MFSNLRVFLGGEVFQRQVIPEGHYYPKDPWDWYIYLHEWLIILANWLVNIPDLDPMG